MRPEADGLGRDIGLVANIQRDFLACSIFIQTSIFARTIQIPIERHILERHRLARCGMDGGERTGELHFRSSCSIAAHPILRDGIPLGVGDGRGLPYQLEPVAVYRAYCRRISPVDIPRTRVYGGYRHVILLAQLQRILPVAEYEEGLARLVGLQHRYAVYRIFLAGLLRVEDVDGAILIVFISLTFRICRIYLHCLVIRVAIIRSLDRRTILIDEPEVDFRLVCKLSDGLQRLVDGTYLQFDITRRRAAAGGTVLGHLHLGWLQIDADVVDGVVGTICSLAIVVYHNAEVGVVLYASILLEHHLTIYLIPNALF